MIHHICHQLRLPPPVRTWSFFCLWTCPSHWRIPAPDWPCWNFSLNMLKKRSKRRAQLKKKIQWSLEKWLYSQSHFEGSPWGRSQSAGPALLRWGRWSVRNIFIPAPYCLASLNQAKQDSYCQNLLRKISVNQPVDTQTAPSPAEVATIHTQ